MTMAGESLTDLGFWQCLCRAPHGLNPMTLRVCPRCGDRAPRITGWWETLACGRGYKDE